MEGYAVILEKKGRGRGMGFGGRPWAVRTFKLVEQNFEYYDGTKLKGVISTKGAKAYPLTPNDAEGKEFPFQLDTTDGEKVMLNGSSWVIRDKCIEVLNRSSKNPKWDNAEENEKYRLEARLRELEHERLQQTAAGAAGAFAESGADASLKKASAAKGAIAAENAKNAASNFKKSSAKKRYRECKASGDRRGMSDAAAEMIQGMIRVKLSKKRIEAQRAIKAQWLRDGYARKIQSKYRQRLAKRKIQKIKWEKGVIGRKLNKLVRMQGVLRAFCAFKRMNRMRMAYPDMVVANVVDLKDFIKVVGTTPEPLAVFNGLCLDLPANHMALNTIRGDVTAKILANHGVVTSTFTSPTTVFPTANSAEGLACASNRLDYLIVTVVDNASASKKDLLGQVCIKLSQVRNLSLGKPITLTLPLGPIKKDVKNAAGESVAVTSRIPTGTITLTICRPLPSLNMSGPVWKVSDNVTAFGAWKKRWFALHKGQLTYFNSESCLESPKASIACSTITAIEEEVVAGRPSIKVTSKVAKGVPSVTWTLGFDENDSKAIRRKWIRVLYRNAPQLTPPVELSAKQLKKQKMEGGSTKA
mmetsp:Transcript_7442/g.15012  ORF Transcript_7442/g.15012 Transcript_7442/m.15012 type:complete len:585 (-) Transcript_7442:521-2275(-)